jgi:hypothetical protein
MIQAFKLSLQDQERLRQTVVRSGLEVRSAETGVSGRIGMLVANAEDRCFALVTTTTVATGNVALLAEGDVEERLGLSRSMELHPEPLGFQSVSSLIAAVPVRSRAPLSANVGGGSPLLAVSALVDVLDEPMKLALDDRQIDLGTLIGHGVTIYFAGEHGQAIPYKGALEFGYTSSYPRLAPGDAGALVVTGNGVPVAMVVGGNKRGVVAVPLFELLRRNGMRPLTTFDVVKREERPAPRPQPVAHVHRPTSPAASRLIKQRDPSDRSREGFEQLVERLRASQRQLADAE